MLTIVDAKEAPLEWVEDAERAQARMQGEAEVVDRKPPGGDRRDKSAFNS